MDSCHLMPLGLVRNAAATVADVPSEGLPSIVEVRPELVPALEGLEPGMHVYVIVLFHQAHEELWASPGTEQQRGAFAVRGSCRPNRLGMTLTRIEQVEGARIHVQWLDFSDGTPVLDIKRYNARWECVFGTRRDNRAFFERSIPREALERVLERPAANYHGESCSWVTASAQAATQLVQEHGAALVRPDLKLRIQGNGHVIDAWQGLTGASFGNGRLEVDHRPAANVAIVDIAQGPKAYRVLLEAGVTPRIEVLQNVR